MGNLEQEIIALEEQISLLNRKLSVLKQQHAEETSPFKVGDIVVDDRGHKGVVARITTGYFGVKVRLFKKDGSLGTRTNDYYSWKATGDRFEGEIYEP
jgi:heterodisulfide reductase subunit A-like polyferredoxin